MACDSLARSVDPPTDTRRSRTSIRRPCTARVVKHTTKFLLARVLTVAIVLRLVIALASPNIGSDRDGRGEMPKGSLHRPMVSVGLR